MQNLKPIALLVLEIRRHKISYGKRERVVKFGYLAPENGFNVKNMGFMSRVVLLDPELTPMSISAIFEQRKQFSFSEFWGYLDEKRAAATLLIDQFC